MKHDAIRQEIAARIAEIEVELAALSRERDLLSTALVALTGLEEPAPKPEPEPEPEPAENGSRLKVVPEKAKWTEVRDWAQKNGDWFHVTELSEHVSGTKTQIGAIVREMAAAGTLERRGPARGPAVAYRFKKPEPKPGPFVAPRGERAGPKGPGPSVGDLSRATGVPVPHARRGGTALKVGTKERWKR